MCAEPTRRIATLTLTVKEQDPAAAIGRVRAFWRRVRQTWVGTRYFCWLELQARGAVHYHAVWLNPPPLKEVNLLAWVDRAWGGGRTQVRFNRGKEALERELAYALKYTEKMKKKAYQQRYDEVPRELRTFMSQQLEIPPDELKKHLDCDEYKYIAESTYNGQHYPAVLRFIQHLEHDWGPGVYCTANDHRRSRSPRPPPRRQLLRQRSTRLLPGARRLVTGGRHDRAR